MVDPRGGRATAATLAVVVVAVDVLLAACTHGTAGHGGATATPTAPIRAKAAPPPPQPSLAAVGNLPAPRSDAQAATIGATSYIVGGFDGTRPDAPVVATTNGQTYRTIATLPVPVRNAAVAALGGPASRRYLHEPDDAYLLKNGQVTVADAVNCRVLVINENHTVARQIGTDGECFHNPPASMSSPNGDTPLPDGNLLISEINGSWVSEYTPAGKLVWTVHLSVVGYPSDPQQVGSDTYLLADYSSPGQVVEFDRHGKILYRYDQASGPGRLNQPSLAELLPSGVIMANDDHNDRMVAIDPSTGALVWQYGITGKPGTGPGQLNIPDGFDLLLPDGSTPTHPATG